MAKRKTKHNDKDKPASASKANLKKPQVQLTPTQLCNARKRRAKLKRKQQQGDTSSSDPSAQYLNNPKAAPLVQAAKQFFSDRLSSFPIYQNGPKTGWRTVSKLPVRRHQGKVVLGMFKPQSHEVATTRNQQYPAHHPSINAAMTTVAHVCQEMGIEVFDEHQGTGYLRYVAMNVERSTGKLQMTLIWKDDPYDGDLQVVSQKKRKKGRASNAREVAQAQLERLLSRLLKVGATRATHEEDAAKSPQKEQSFQLHSLWVHYNNAWKHSNAIFDITSTAKNNSYQVYGPATITEELNTNILVQLSHSPILHFGPNVFRQANLDAFGHIIAAIRNRIQKLKSSHISCLELYGGVGTIGLHLVDIVTELICSDENPHNQACFDASRALLPNNQQSKLTYVPHNATDMVNKNYLENRQVVIVDPPRKGLDPVVLDRLVESTTTSTCDLLVYVSCGFDAFQRDCQRLTDQKRWKLEHAEGHILFPGANAIETLAFFTPGP